MTTAVDIRILGDMPTCDSQVWPLPTRRSRATPTAHEPDPRDSRQLLARLRHGLPSDGLMTTTILATLDAIGAASTPSASVKPGLSRGPMSALGGSGRAAPEARQIVACHDG